MPNVCATVRFLPALKVTVSPGTTLVAVAEPVNVPPLAEALAFQPELLIAFVTFVVVAMPFVVGATALPSVLVVIFSPTLAVIFTPFASADVEMNLSSPLIFKVPSFNNTSLLPVSPAYFKLTAFNCATLTASVS